MSTAYEAYCQEAVLDLLNGSATVPWLKEAIPDSERSKEIKSIDTDKDNPHVQRALGIRWCVRSDTFGFSICPKPRSPTRRCFMPAEFGQVASSQLYHFSDASGDEYVSYLRLVNEEGNIHCAFMSTGVPTGEKRDL